MYGLIKIVIIGFNADLKQLRIRKLPFFSMAMVLISLSLSFATVLGCSPSGVLPARSEAWPYHKTHKLFTFEDKPGCDPLMLL